MKKLFLLSVVHVFIYEFSCDIYFSCVNKMFQSCVNSLTGEYLMCSFVVSSVVHAFIR